MSERDDVLRQARRAVIRMAETTGEQYDAALQELTTLLMSEEVAAVLGAPDVEQQRRGVAFYENDANRLVQRIREVAATQPQILELTDPWDMFKVPGFKCDDIGPSLFQAGWALRRAKELGPL